MAKNQNEVLLKAFENGAELSERVADYFYGVRNLRARVAELREEGYAIYTNTQHGHTTYRLGQPSREMVRIAYRARGPKVFR